MRGNGGRDALPGRPTAAPLTANAPLLMERGADMETTAGRRRGTRGPEGQLRVVREDRTRARAADEYSGPWRASDPERDLRACGSGYSD